MNKFILSTNSIFSPSDFCFLLIFYIIVETILPYSFKFLKLILQISFIFMLSIAKIVGFNGLNFYKYPIVTSSEIQTIHDTLVIDTTKKDKVSVNILNFDSTDINSRIKLNGDTGFYKKKFENKISKSEIKKDSIYALPHATNQINLDTNYFKDLYTHKKKNFFEKLKFREPSVFNRKKDTLTLKDSNNVGLNKVMKKVHFEIETGAVYGTVQAMPEYSSNTPLYYSQGQIGFEKIPFLVKYRISNFNNAIYGLNYINFTLDTAMLKSQRAKFKVDQFNKQKLYNKHIMDSLNFEKFKLNQKINFSKLKIYNNNNKFSFGNATDSLNIPDSLKIKYPNLENIIDDSKYKKQIKEYEEKIRSLDQKLNVYKNLDSINNIDYKESYKSKLGKYSIPKLPIKLNKFNFGMIQPNHGEFAVKGCLLKGLDTEIEIKKVTLHATTGGIIKQQFVLPFQTQDSVSKKIIPNINFKDTSSYYHSTALTASFDLINELGFYTSVVSNKEVKTSLFGHAIPLKFSDTISNNVIESGIRFKPSKLFQLNLSTAQSLFKERQNSEYPSVKHSSFNNFNQALYGKIISEINNKTKLEITSKRVLPLFQNKANPFLRKDIWRSDVVLSKKIRKNLNIKISGRHDFDNLLKLKTRTNKLYMVGLKAQTKLSKAFTISCGVSPYLQQVVEDKEIISSNTNLIYDANIGYYKRKGEHNIFINLGYNESINSVNFTTNKIKNTNLGITYNYKEFAAYSNISSIFMQLGDSIISSEGLLMNLGCSYSFKSRLDLNTEVKSFLRNNEIRMGYGITALYKLSNLMSFALGIEKILIDEYATFSDNITSYIEPYNLKASIILKK
jgi:hypothetical protein